MSSITLSQADYDALMALVAKSKEARQEIKRLCTLGRPLGRWDFQTALFGSLFNAIDAVEDVKPLESILLVNDAPTIPLYGDNINPEMAKLGSLTKIRSYEMRTDLPAAAEQLIAKDRKANAKRNADRPGTKATKSRSK